MNRYPYFWLIFIALTPSVFSQAADTSDSVKPVETIAPVTVKSNQTAALENVSAFPAKIADFDSNDDGVLSRREIPAKNSLTAEFHLVDRNHNGYITVAELKTSNWK